MKKLCFKNPDNSKFKWSTIGTVKSNDKGEYIIICIDHLEEALKLIKGHNMAKGFNGKLYINMPIFVNEDKPVDAHTEAKQNGYQPDFGVDELSDEIPF